MHPIRPLRRPDRRAVITSQPYTLQNMKQNPKIKLGAPATINRAELPTLIAQELSDYYAFNAARVIGRMHGRTRLQWQDGHSAWFDDEAIIPLFP